MEGLEFAVIVAFVSTMTAALEDEKACEQNGTRVNLTSK
jgi:hypothetical protein